MLNEAGIGLEVAADRSGGTPPAVGAAAAPAALLRFGRLGFEDLLDRGQYQPEQEQEQEKKEQELQPGQQRWMRGPPFGSLNTTSRSTPLSPPQRSAPVQLKGEGSPSRSAEAAASRLPSPSLLASPQPAPTRQKKGAAAVRTLWRTLSAIERQYVRTAAGVAVRCGRLAHESVEKLHAALQSDPDIVKRARTWAATPEARAADAAAKGPKKVGVKKVRTVLVGRGRTMCLRGLGARIEEGAKSVAVIADAHRRPHHFSITGQAGIAAAAAASRE